MFDKQLRPLYNGRVLANQSAMDDPVVVSTLDSLARRNFVFHTATGMKTWNISDRH